MADEHTPVRLAGINRQLCRECGYRPHHEPNPIKSGKVWQATPMGDGTYRLTKIRAAR